jgi:DNA-binding transcriptional MerR regulator
MPKQLYSITDLAKLLGVAEHRIHYAHRCGKLAAPTFMVAGKRVYTESDLKRVAKHFDVDLENTNAGTTA